MTTFKQQMAADLAAVFYNNAEFAEPVVYTPVTGDAMSCDVIIDHDVLIQADGYDVNMATLGTTVTAMVSDVGTVNRGDTFTLESGKVYTVQRIERYSEDGREVTVVVK
jgi:hypothetical protein